MATPEDPVESILAQAADLCTLEQIAALNVVHLPGSILPTDLETRFRKLASFPPPPVGHCPLRRLRTDTNIPAIPNQFDTNPSPPTVSPLADHQVSKSEPSLPPTSAKPISINDSDPRSRSGMISSPTVSSPSPREKVGCFGCYPKRRQRKKSVDDGYWETNDAILADLNDEERKLKKMIKEQEKVNRETEKVLGLVKQASARLVLSHELQSEEDEEL